MRQSAVLLGRLPRLSSVVQATQPSSAPAQAHRCSETPDLRIVLLRLWSSAVPDPSQQAAQPPLTSAAQSSQDELISGGQQLLSPAAAPTSTPTNSNVEPAAFNAASSGHRPHAGGPGAREHGASAQPQQQNDRPPRKMHMRELHREMDQLLRTRRPGNHKHNTACQMQCEIIANHPIYYGLLYGSLPDRVCLRVPIRPEVTNLRHWLCNKQALLWICSSGTRSGAAPGAAPSQTRWHRPPSSSAAWHSSR